MRRGFDEISDDEWDNHSFKPSRILKKPKPSPPPPIESFAYRPNVAKTAVNVVNLSDDDNDWDLADNNDDDSWNISDDEGTAAAEAEVKGVGAEYLDDDIDEQQPTTSERALPPRSTRGRRYVIDEDSDFENGAFEVEDDDDEEEEFAIEEKKRDDGGEQFDVVGKALRKCAKISMELKKELYGSSSVSAERYAEVEASSAARIVTQDDVNAACAGEDSDFEPILKPYQLVGVNFLLLLYRKNIGGGNFLDLFIDLLYTWLRQYINLRFLKNAVPLVRVGLMTFIIDALMMLI